MATSPTDVHASEPDPTLADEPPGTVPSGERTRSLQARSGTIAVPEPLADHGERAPGVIDYTGSDAHRSQTIWYDRYDQAGEWQSNYFVQLLSGRQVATGFADPEAIGFAPVEGRMVRGSPLLVQRTDGGTGTITVYAFTVSEDEAILVGSRWATDAELLRVVDAIGSDS